MAVAPPRPARTKKRISLSLAPAIWVALGLGAVVAYAAFADGAIAQPMEARLQVAIAALALVALAAFLFSPTMRIAAGRFGWTGVVLLALFTIWTGVSFAWSIAPDGTWGE